MGLFFSILRGVRAIWHWFLGVFRSKARGEARWMPFEQVHSFLHKKNKGLIIAPNRCLSLNESYKNLALIAPTGSGKTTRFVIPNILNCSGNIVVTDPSGEIFKATSGHMQNRGYKMQILAPSDLQNSLRFNPLKRFDTKQELKQITTTLAQNNAGNDPFWTTSANNLLYVFLSALKNLPDKNMAHLGNVRKLLNNCGADGELINDFMTQHLNDEEFDEFKAFLAQDIKVISSILSSARTALDLWSDQDIVNLTGSDNIDLDALRDGKTIIYVIVPEDKIKYFSIVINLFYSACFTHCIKHNGKPVFFFLDEFGNLGSINNFASIITTLRKRKCSISIILQELSQIEAIYGKNDSKSIFSGGCANKLFYSGLDLETCKYLENVLGHSTAYDTTFQGVDDKAQTVAKPLMSTDQIRMLNKSKGVLISGSELPINIKMPPFYSHKPWLTMTKKTPTKIDFKSPLEPPASLLFKKQPITFKKKFFCSMSFSGSPAFIFIYTIYIKFLSYTALPSVFYGSILKSFLAEPFFP